MRARRGQPGFVLLISLVLILLAGVALAHVARRSILGALESQSAAEELQRRWAVTSCRATFLPRAGRILDQSEQNAAEGGQDARPLGGRRANELRVSCRLAGLEYDLVFTDEQAKLNVNDVLARRGRAEVQSLVKDLVAESAGGRAAASRVRLRTRATPRSGSDPGGGKVGGYGQVFENVAPARLLGLTRGDGLAAEVTCWGSGQVNVRRASAEVIRQACRGRLSGVAVESLLAARQRGGSLTLSALLTQADGLDEKQRTRAEQILTDRSACHGLWVIARGRQRSWYTLAIGDRSASDSAAADGGGEGRIRRWREFAW